MKGLDATIELRATVFPTEDQAKIEAGLLALFPDIKLEREQDELIGTSKSLDTFMELLKKYRIRDTARDTILKNRDGDTSVFLLNKQIATVSKVCFAEEGEGSLGDIRVSLTLQDWDGFVALLTPHRIE